TVFWDVEGVALRTRRPGAREFRVDDYGAPPYPELVLTTTRRTIDDEPGLVSSTVRALVRGYEFTRTDPDSSEQDLLAANRGVDVRVEREDLRRALRARRDVAGGEVDHDDVGIGDAVERRHELHVVAGGREHRLDAGAEQQVRDERDDAGHY